MLSSRWPADYWTGRPDRHRLNEVDFDVDVASCGLRVRADLVRGVHESLSDLAVQARQADVEASPEEETAVIRTQVYLCVDGPVGREGDLPLGGRQPDRTHEARRPAGGEQLLRVRTGPGRAGCRELDVEAAVGGAGRAVPAAGGVSLRGVEHFFGRGHDRLLFKLGEWWRSRELRRAGHRQEPL